MSDLCEVLKNFDKSTQMVSGDNAIISVTIPLLCLSMRRPLSGTMTESAGGGSMRRPQSGTMTESGGGSSMRRPQSGTMTEYGVSAG